MRLYQINIWGWNVFRRGEEDVSMPGNEDFGDGAVKTPQDLQKLLVRSL